MRIYDQITTALRTCGQFQNPHDKELRNWDQWFLPPEVRSVVEEDFKHGNGRELDGDISKANSSAALVLNTFARWRCTPETLRIGSYGNFSRLQFEKRCPIFSDHDQGPAHPDIVAEFADCILAVESKFR